jgi:hypothetical protein
MPKKTRTFNAPLVQGRTRSSSFVPWTNYTNVLPISTETSEGVGNRWNGYCWDGGSGWRLSRTTHTYLPEAVAVDSFNAGGTLLGEGTTRIGGPTISVPSLSLPNLPTDGELDAMGSTAIARTEPTAPSFDLSVFLGELMREGIPVAPGHQTMVATARAKAAGSEYLNLEFGWLPLVGGIEDFSNTVKNADEILRQYEMSANEPVKRRYDWPPHVETKYTPCNFSTVSPSRGFFTKGGRWQEVEQRFWFEASYVYHLPVGSDADARMRRYGSYARKLLGVDLSPEVLWNLAPWSWAVDYFSNTGDVIHNISAMGQDGMVMRYGHIMCHTRRTTRDSGSIAGNHQVHVTTEEWKTRRPATPFGFGVSFSDLTPKQIAILAALGLSRW